MPAAAVATEPLLSARGIHVVAGGVDHAIVDRADLTLTPGRSLAIAGESGSGKTALIQALLGYARPGLSLDAGSVSIGGRELRANRPEEFLGVRGSVITYVAQSASSLLNPIMRVGDQLVELATRTAPGPAASERIGALLAAVGFDEPELIDRRYPHQLSGGQRQRVTIAMALLPEPRVVLLDEATTDLDVVTQLRIVNLIRRLRLEQGFEIVAVSHDLNVLAALCMDLLVMHKGRIVERGPLQGLLEAPAHPYTAELVRRFTDGAAARGTTGAPAPDAASGVDPVPVDT